MGQVGVLAGPPYIYNYLVCFLSLLKKIICYDMNGLKGTFVFVSI